MRRLKLTTRGSPLALWQAAAVRDALATRRLDWPLAEIVTVHSSGERVRDRALSELGGKGAFCREIDRPVIAGEADLAVHSMKDVETVIDDALVLAAMLPREDARDAFLSPVAGSLEDLPEGAVVGSSSIRRRAQLLRWRPDLRVILYRGNVGTRLAKLEAGDADATILAVSGLKRLGRADAITAALDPEVMRPASGQGAIGVTCRSDDADLVALLAEIDHGPTHAAVAAERAVLARLDGSCQTPVAAHATIANGCMTLDALVLSADGTRWASARREGAVAAAVALGDAAGAELLAAAGRDLFGSRPT
ncbi:MAG: hydroxymethylbilane synthase [Rhodospirillales bacterium]|nr:hydroxymethylbilane synthase [Rhodospirillales bacterium]